MTNTPNVKPNCGCPANRPCAFTGFGHTDRAVRGVKPENDPLTKAIAALGAVEVAPVVRSGEQRLFAQQVVDLPGGFTAYLSRLNGRVEWLVYNLEKQTHVLMPPWWSPQTQYAIKQRERNGEGATWARATREEAAALKARFDIPSEGARAVTNRVITADLVTGEEVPC